MLRIGMTNHFFDIRSVLRGLECIGDKIDIIPDKIKGLGLKLLSPLFQLLAADCRDQTAVYSAR